MHTTLRSPPVSIRDSFALAFNLAGRDVPHSILLPLILRAPWILAQALLPLSEDTAQPELTLLLSLAALVGDVLTLLIVTAMLRMRARSVFGIPGAAPAPATTCYTVGLARVPWLLVTEIARTILVLFSMLFFLFPAFFVSFRLAVAAEAVTLDQPDMPAAFRRSFNSMSGRFGQWFGMSLVSIMLIGAVAMGSGIVAGVMTRMLPSFEFGTGVAMGQLAVAALLPVIHYAWTFFYLEIVEGERAVAAAVGGAGEGGLSATLAAPRVTLAPGSTPAPGGEFSSGSEHAPSPPGPPGLTDRPMGSPGTPSPRPEPSRPEDFMPPRPPGRTDPGEST